MKQLTDVFKEFFQSISQRISTPIIGIFILTWIIFNWDDILYLCFSQNIIEDKIAFVKDNNSNVDWALPFMFAIFMSLFIPVARFCLEFIINKINLLRKWNEMDYKHKEYLYWKRIFQSEVDVEVFKAVYKEKLQRKLQDMKVEDLAEYAKEIGVSTKQKK